MEIEFCNSFLMHKGLLFGMTFANIFAGKTRTTKSFTPSKISAKTHLCSKSIMRCLAMPRSYLGMKKFLKTKTSWTQPFLLHNSLNLTSQLTSLPSRLKKSRSPPQPSHKLRRHLRSMWTFPELKCSQISRLTPHTNLG